MNMPANETQDVQEAGTGFMMPLVEALHSLQRKGYVENLIPCFDHLEAQSGKYHVFPDDILVDRVYRFENTSDPDDQSIAYAITCPKAGIKGVYVESYGVYHDELSPEMESKLKDHEH
jgi:hypothetical protein